MTKIEYKMVSYEPGLGKRLVGDDFGEGFLHVLSEQGQHGWDLKAVIQKSGMEIRLVFSRPAA